MVNLGAAIFLFLSTITASLNTYFSAVDEFTSHDRVIIAAIVLCVISVQLIIAYSVHRFIRFAALTNLLFSIFVVFNILCMRLIFDAGFTIQTLYVRVFLLLVGVFILYTLFNAGTQNKKGWIWVSGFALAFAVLDLGPHVFDAFRGKEYPREIRFDEEGTASPRIRLVDFTRTPNVYMVSFDSLIPRSLVQENLGLQEVAYLPVLERRFETFRNVFADAVYTRTSLNAVLALDMKWFWDIGKHRTMLFQGKVPSPLFQIFKSNGYETNTLYRSNYFGLEKGDYLDRYYIVRSFSACEFVDKKQVIAFFGYCWVQGTEHWRRFVISVFGKQEDNQIDWVLNRFAEARKSGKPQVFLAYLYSPGHTKKDYDQTNADKRLEYKDIFRKRSVGTAAMIDKLVEYVGREDSDSILVVFGDHGPKMSAASNLDDDPRFFVVDRYGVFGGVYANGVCESEVETLKKNTFVTPSIMMRKVIQCLSAGQDPFLDEPEYILQKAQFLPKTLRYEDFLYE